ncbi:MAG: DUF6327 family protein [Flavobacteriaceae bacterium]|jgi:hypothetical protein|nr:DUF6327 family protein [Flavobacteriaceae bacterium]
MERTVKKKTYSSIEEINRDLNILKMERDLYYQKILHSVDLIKDETTPNKLVRSTFGAVSSYVRNSKGIKTYLTTALIRFVMKKINRK